MRSHYSWRENGCLESDLLSNDSYDYLRYVFELCVSVLQMSALVYDTSEALTEMSQHILSLLEETNTEMYRHQNTHQHDKVFSGSPGLQDDPHLTFLRKS